MNPLFLFVEAARSLKREFRRIAPMASGIVWGVASVFLLSAIAGGFEQTQRQALAAFGESFLLLRLNRTTGIRGDAGAQKDVRLDYEDIERIRRMAPAVAAVSPKAFAWGARVLHGGEASWMSLTGVDPDFARICNVPLEPGSRFLDAHDMEQAAPVVVLGYQLREDLFGDLPCVGEKIQIAVRSGGKEPMLRQLTVIGAIRNEELSTERYVSNRDVGYVPFPVFERLWTRGSDFFVVRPRTKDAREEALGQIRAALAERHGFRPGDVNAVMPYFDAIERSRRIDRVFGGLHFFLGAVGILILLLGAVGVANVVLMSVAARTFEFGLRRALGCRRRWIFAQVFFEAGGVCAASGFFGFLLGMGGVRLLTLVRLPEGFAAPAADASAALLPAALLIAVSLVAAIWPASRAVRVAPVVALRRGGL